MMKMLPSSNRGGERSGDESPRRRWLGLGNNVSPGSPPTRGADSNISDDIRKLFADDCDLFFADPPSPLTDIVQSSASASQLTKERMNLSRSKSGVDITRRASQQKMEDLQREVDLALEFFHQETDNELDHPDGDEYLEDHTGRYQGVKKGKIYGRGREESGDSFPGTARTSVATSMATSMATSVNNYDNEFDDCQFVRLLSEPETESPITSGGLSMKHKTKSILSLPLSLLTSQAAMDCSEDEDDDVSMKCETLVAKDFRKNGVVDFNSSRSLRDAMEPFLAVARESMPCCVYSNFADFFFLIPC